MTEPRLEETGRGLTVHAEGRYLYSNRDPSGRPERIAASAALEERCIYLVPSPLLGYGLSTLAERIPQSSIILAVEASQELMALCSPAVSDRLLSHPSIHWVRLSDRNSLHSLLREIGPWKFRRVRRLDLSAGASINSAVFEDLNSFLSEDLAVYWKNRHALSRLGRDWIRHSLANIALRHNFPDLFKPIESMDCSGIPVVIGAGPSLEETMPFLKNNREKLNLLATDTAVAALTAFGIRPDAIIALETQAWNMLDFHGLAGSGIPLIADLTSYPPGMTITGGPVYLFSSRFADLTFLDRLEEAGLRPSVVPPLGSVGLAALEIALKLNEGPVLLTGLDFAYTPGKSHARGTSVHRWQLAVSGRTDPIPGWQASMKRPKISVTRSDGRRIHSDAVLAGYAAGLTDRYGSAGRVYVLAPGGLDLGLPVVDPENILETLEAAGLPGTLSESGGQKSSDAPIRTSAAGDFLTEETQRLQSVIRAWENYVEGSASADSVAATLEGLDELFCDFPDEPPLPKSEDSFLVRAVSRSRRILRYIARQRLDLQTVKAD